MIELIDNVLVLMAAIVLAAAAVAVVRRYRRRRTGPLPEPPGLHIDVEQLPDIELPRDGPQLEFYHVPVRLAALVVAPVGRDARLPSAHEVSTIVGQIVPGFDELLRTHQPILDSWPAQLSSHGFIQAFFANVPLPGNGGKGTRWSSLAGKVEVEELHLLVGMVFATARPDSLGQTALDRPTGWLDVLRVRPADPK